MQNTSKNGRPVLTSVINLYHLPNTTKLSKSIRLSFFLVRKRGKPNAPREKPNYFVTTLVIMNFTYIMLRQNFTNLPRNESRALEMLGRYNVKEKFSKLRDGIGNVRRTSILRRSRTNILSISTLQQYRTNSFGCFQASKYGCIPHSSFVYFLKSFFLLFARKLMIYFYILQQRPRLQSRLIWILKHSLCQQHRDNIHGHTS